MRIVTVPTVTRELRVSLDEAKKALEELMSDGLIRETEKGGLVPIYEVTGKGYSAAETVREKPLLKFFGQPKD